MATTGAGNTSKTVSKVTSTSTLSMTAQQAAQRAAEAAQKAAAAKAQAEAQARANANLAAAEAAAKSRANATLGKTVADFNQNQADWVANKDALAEASRRASAEAQAKVDEWNRQMAMTAPVSTSTYIPPVPQASALSTINKAESQVKSPLPTGLLPDSDKVLQNLAKEWDSLYKYVIDDNGKPLFKNFADFAQQQMGSVAIGAGNLGPLGAVKPTVAPEWNMAPQPQVTQGEPWMWRPDNFPSSVPTNTTGTQTEAEGETVSIGQPSLPDITWAEKYQVEGAPSWWKGYIPSRNDPQTEYASLMNSMIPYMSPEDQRSTASFLYRLYPDVFSTYNPEIQAMPAIPTELSTETQRWMTSLQRANNILDTLSKVKTATGSDQSFGPGYEYLRALGTILRDMGNESGVGQTRLQRQNQVSALDPLTAETSSDNLSAYSTLTRMLSQPYYSAGSVNPTTTLSNGQVIPGRAVSNYF